MLLRVAFSVSLTLPLMATELKVDHATVAGKDLGAMERALQAAGLPFEYGGPHANHATEMALTSFPDGSYLELIAIQPHADAAAVAASPWNKCMQANAGPCAWAVRPAALATEATRLQIAGIEVTTPVKNGRRRPDGEQLTWETAQVGDGNGNFFPFLIHDFTDRNLRAFPSGRPTTMSYTGIVKVVLAVNDLNEAVARYRKAYGFGEALRQEDAMFGAKLAWFSGTPVILAAPDGSKSWLANRLRQFGELPCAFVLGGGKTAQSGSNWFGKTISWLAPEKLGWRLGVEP